MQRLMVQYKVKPERAADNESYIARVFEQLEREKPAGLRYASFKLEDGVSFVHLVSIEAADGRNRLSEQSAFKTFAYLAAIASKKATSEIDSYGFFEK